MYAYMDVYDLERAALGELLVLGRPLLADESQLGLGQLADVEAHHVLELVRAQLALLVAQRPVLREARKVRRRHVDAGGEVLPRGAGRRAVNETQLDPRRTRCLVCACCTTSK